MDSGLSLIFLHQSKIIYQKKTIGKHSDIAVDKYGLSFLAKYENYNTKQGNSMTLQYRRKVFKVTLGVLFGGPSK
jgi:hypothetical protein